MSCLSEIGLSRKQRVFVTLEATCGSMTFPSATADFILPAGDAVLNQNPAFVDSDEKKNTLDILDRFQNAMPAGSWSIPMYLRIPDKSYATPQGDGLFQAWQGQLAVSTVASNSDNWATSTPELIHIEGIIDLDGFPGVGVVEVASVATTQQVHYGVLYQAENSATASLGDLTMGYNGTTPATAAPDLDSPTSVTLVSRFYNQDTDSPSVTIWIETDHFVQGLSGATVNNVSLGVNNEGAVTFEYGGEGMEMIWAGQAVTSAVATAGVEYITVPAGHGKRFSVGAFIYNLTTTPGTAASIGFQIESITSLGGANGGDLITLATPIIGPNHNFAWNIPVGDWATESTIRGYLPLSPTTIGTPIESRLTDIEINNVSAKIKGMDFTFSVPKQYVADEVGTDFPEDYLENVREITSTLSVYFTKDNAKYFTDGFDGTESPVLVVLGDTQGDKMEIYMKKCALEVPTVTFAAPAVELSIPLKALGTFGEDSCDVVLT